jgi:hypothetical protein
MPTRRFMYVPRLYFGFRKLWFQMIYNGVSMFDGLTIFAFVCFVFHIYNIQIVYPQSDACEVFKVG